MFGSEDALIKIDMSEFMERHTVSRLVGAPPGYVGYDEGGQLTEAVRRKTYCVVLLDEIEKAHPEAFNMLLQIMEDGHLTDAKGRRVDFRNTIIIMTCNVGAEQMQQGQQHRLPARAAPTRPPQATAEYDRMKEKVLGELKKTFRPEFLNRIDATVVFRPLTREQIREIVDLLLARVKDAARRAADGAGGDRCGQGRDHRQGLRPGVRRPAAAPRDPEPDRGPARRAHAARPASRPATRSWSTPTPRAAADDRTRRSKRQTVKAGDKRR